MDPQKTALLSLDIQQGILQMVAASEAILPAAAEAAEFARRQKFKIIHVGLGFRPGYPEVGDSPTFKRVKDMNLFEIGTASAEFHPSVAKPGELIVHKHRVSGFSENQLHMILRANGITDLVLMGIATSGIVLSTLRRAYDLDYRCVVLKDACFDRDPEVHRVLTEKVFANQATVMTVGEFTRQGS